RLSRRGGSSERRRAVHLHHGLQCRAHRGEVRQRAGAAEAASEGGAQDGTGTGPHDAVAAQTLRALRTRSALRGRSLNRTPIASLTAFPMAAAVGPWAASPVPRKGSPGRSMISTSIVS